MSRPARIGLIINPVSGTGGRPSVARQRLELGAALLRARGLAVEPALTARPGHARELAAGMLASGAALVIAWGGDGTVNEVGSVLAFSDAALGIVPSGSGNGLARELRIPRDPRDAFRVALDGRTRAIDAGELDGRLFFNVAGLGLDAQVAHRFAAGGLVRRGFRRYLTIAARELFAFVPDDHTIVAGGEVLRSRALLVAVANARQHGNGALIAPGARVDDGALDVVVVDYRPPWRALRQAPMLFLGRVTRVAGVRTRRAAEIAIASSRPALCHVDGEPFTVGTSIQARVHPRALKVRVESWMVDGGL